MLRFAMRAMLVLGMVFGVAVAVGVGTGQFLPRGDWEELLFLANTGYENYPELTTLDLKQGLMAKITRMPDLKHPIISFVDYSPDGSKIILHDHAEGIYLKDSMTNRPRLIAEYPFSSSFWMPKGHAIGYYSQRNTKRVLKIHDLRTDHVEYIENVDWKSLYFSSNDQIAVLEQFHEETSKLYVTKDIQYYLKEENFVAERAYDPVWSPDGKMIAFIQRAWSYTSLISQGIYIYHVEQKVITKLTDYGELPTWSSDNSSILFFDWQTKSLYTVDVKSKEVKEYYTIQNIPLYAAFSRSEIDWRPAKN